MRQAHLSVFLALALLPSLNAQIDHRAKWLGATNLTYGLVDLDGFSPGGYGYCRWGNYMDSNTFGAVDLAFSWLTAAPYSNDLFIIRSDLSFMQRETYGGLQFPMGAIWTAPKGPFSRGFVEFNATQNQLQLFRYLHFQNQLIDESNGTNLPASTRKLVVLIHGWNSGSLSDSYSTSEFTSLVSALKSALANSDWRLARYRWEADADTGMVDLLTLLTLGQTGIDDATEASEISNQHGQHLGEILSRGFPNLEKIHLIAHSAGSWAARAAVRNLLKNVPAASVQITLLDPFIPAAGNANSALSTSAMNAITTVAASQQLKMLENYYSEDITGSSTQQLFAAWNLNQRIFPAPNSQRFYYKDHSGAIQFYADTVRATIAGQSESESLAPFDVRPTSSVRVGWTRGLFYNEPIIQTAPQNQTAVVGATVSLSATASSRNSGAADSNVTYQWRRNGSIVSGATAATLRINSAQSSDAGDYTITVSNAWGATTSSAATLVVGGLAPAIVTQPQNQTVVAGQTITFDVTASGTPAPGYEWRKDGTSIAGATTATLTLKNVQPGDVGNYAVVVSNSAGSITSSTATLTIVDAPAITTQPTSRTVVLGAGTVFSVSATGSGALSYQWRKDGAAIAGATTATLTFSSSQPSDAGSYTVVVSNSAGTVTSSAATLTIDAPPTVILPTIATQPVSRTAAVGAGTIFSVSATGSGTLSYQWRKDGAPIAGATTTTLTFNSVQPSDAGSYSVVVSNSAGSATSTTAVLNVSFSQLINLSILTTVTPSAPMFTVGTVIGGPGTSGSKPLLVRAVGPSLTQLGVTSTLFDPKLDVLSAQTVVATNDNWGGTAALSTAFAQVGAFAYSSAASRDAAVFNPALPVGAYTIQISGVGGATGTVLAELYDSTPSGTVTATTPRLVNLSVLKQIDAGEILVAGFVIAGTASKQVLIRAVGPGLTQFFVNDAMADPRLDLFRAQTVINSNDNWGGGSALATAVGNVGAFALSVASRDAALLVELPPGNYTAQLSGVNGSGGRALIEVYEVP